MTAVVTRTTSDPDVAPNREKYLAWKARRRAVKYDESEPRVPAGDPAGGQWTSGGGAPEQSRLSGIKTLDDFITARGEDVPARWRAATPQEMAQAVVRSVEGTGTNVDPALWSGADPQTFRETMAQFVALKDQFPEARIDELQPLTAEMLAASSHNVGAEPNAWTAYDADGTVRIALNGTYFGQEGPLVGALYTLNDGGWHPEGTNSPAGVITHEFGHALAEALDRRYAHPDAKDSPAAKTWNAYWRGMGADGHISGYGEDGGVWEEFAERFTASYAPGSRATEDPRAISLRNLFAALKVGATP